MDSAYRFEPLCPWHRHPQVLPTLLADLAFAIRPLAARPAQTIRAQE